MWVFPLLVTIVATAEVKGTAEPCGCNSDPLGDVARVATLARGGLLLDAGSISYNREELTAERRPQGQATAAALAHIYGSAAVGLGADDLALGAKGVKGARQACNVRGMALQAPRVVTVNGVKIGVFGVVTPERVAPLKAAEPVAAAEKAVAGLRRKGAQLVVALAGMNRLETRALLKGVPGIDFAIVGAEVGDGMAEPEPVGDAWLAAPGDLARYAVKIDASLYKPGKRFVLFAGEAAQQRARDKAQRRIAELTAQIAEWKKDPTADKAFVQAREDELAELKEQALQWGKALPLEPPKDTNYFTYELVAMRHTIARDPHIADELKRLAHAIGQANLKAAQGKADPAAEPGAATYVGNAACEKCHKPAMEFWKGTVHAHAWKSLVDVDKQYNYDCIGCHVTGFEKPGGVTLASAEKRKLVDVGCETCHGPGSLHVAEAGMEEPRSLARAPTEGYCADNCHTKEHSDTFTLVPYLRDILGKGHGEKARAKLGDGPTGHELRKKALEAAGR